jgi:hypothetical protein
VQKYPLLNNGKWSKKYHHTGQSNRLKQKYSVRNVMLEPSLANGSDVVLGALKSTSKAFEANRPAIVSTHRLNYMGRISPENRDRGLKHLQDFLTAVMDKWPDAQFIHSARLSDILFGRA